jgi:hypothetical protein
MNDLQYAPFVLSPVFVPDGSAVLYASCNVLGLENDSNKGDLILKPASREVSHSNDPNQITTSRKIMITIHNESSLS